MYKIIKILFSLLIFSFVASSQEKDPYQEFLDEVAKGFGAEAIKVSELYKLGDYDRWDADQDTGKLVLSNKGKTEVVTSFQIAGSYSTISKTWKWSWANDTVEKAMKIDMHKIKEFGEENQFKELTTEQWECEEDYAWTMAAVAGHVTKAKGVYRGRIPDGFVYLLITEISWANEKSGR